MKKLLSNWKKTKIQELFEKGMSISGIVSTVKVSKYNIYKTVDDSTLSYPKHLKERLEREAKKIDG